MPKNLPVQKIVSGGQTGVDRAALDAGMQAGLSVGGWCPTGRWAEDGPIAASYPLQETEAADPAERTRLNVRDSDATLILARGGLAGGTLLTRQLAEQMGREVLHVNLAQVNPTLVLDWLESRHVKTLNVAGPRESEDPGIYDAAHPFLLAVLRC